MACFVVIIGGCSLDASRAALVMARTAHTALVIAEPPPRQTTIKETWQSLQSLTADCTLTYRKEPPPEVLMDDRADVLQGIEDVRQWLAHHTRQILKQRPRHRRPPRRALFRWRKQM